nr:MAG TPA: hypothetical protein [Caudoviricetes sp.]
MGASSIDAVSADYPILKYFYYIWVVINNLN